MGEKEDVRDFASWQIGGGSWRRSISYARGILTFKSCSHVNIHVAHYLQDPCFCKNWFGTDTENSCSCINWSSWTIKNGSALPCKFLCQNLCYKGGCFYWKNTCCDIQRHCLYQVYYLLDNANDFIWNNGKTARTGNLVYTMDYIWLQCLCRVASWFMAMVLSVLLSLLLRPRELLVWVVGLKVYTKLLRKWDTQIVQRYLKQ